MAYFWKMPLTQDELQEGQSEDQASYSMYHFNPDSQVSLGLDQIVGEGSSEIPFYGPAYSHDPKENEFFLDAAEEHLYRIDPPQIPHRDLYFGSPTSHWQQVRLPPTIGFRPSLLSGYSDLSENSYPTYPIGTLYDYGPYGRNNLSPTADEFGSDVEKENTNLNVCIGFEHIDYQYPVFSDNNASGQGMQDKRRNDSKSFLVSTGETYLTNPPRELTTGPVWPSISANSSADSTEVSWYNYGTGFSKCSSTDSFRILFQMSLTLVKDTRLTVSRFTAMSVEFLQLLLTSSGAEYALHLRGMLSIFQDQTPGNDSPLCTAWAASNTDFSQAAKPVYFSHDLGGERIIKSPAFNLCHLYGDSFKGEACESGNCDVYMIHKRSYTGNYFHIVTKMAFL
nr:uncharacterized protein LOC122173556 [Chrysemys picta bellii]